MERIIFYILAALILGFSLLSVTSTKILRAAVYLFLVLIGIAGFYFQVGYHFLGAVQLTVYAGGIIVLIIFAILLTERIDSQLPRPKLTMTILSGLAVLVGAIISIVTILGHVFDKKSTGELATVDTIGTRLLSFEPGGYVLPFELISVLLLAAMIGAIVIAKRPKIEK